ncbi:MAG: hypothetical protein LBN39_07930 [Planctomycetaceae bacterium]|jgi:hypothetical protein|nr:hypothetical protein [Planctomycetaceae bacterium]
MLDKLLKISGTAALYFCAGMFLATLILAAVLSYSWNIDKAKRLKMLAIAQGLEIADIQQAVTDRIAQMTYEQILEERAKRLRNQEFQKESSEETVTKSLIADEKKIDAKLKQIGAKEKAFDQKIKDYQKKASAKGIVEETRLIEEAEPEQGKDIILGIIKDFGDYERVLTMLLAMDEKRRGEILYAMTVEEEKKKLVELLQKIGNGEPLSKVAQEAAKEAEKTEN